MQPASKRTLDHSRQSGRSGLRDPHRRILMRIILSVTAITLGLFSSLQFTAGNYWLASLEAFGCLALVVGMFRIGTSPYLHRWIIGYLIPTFSFLVLITMVPNASSTAFVWAYAMPVLSYLLLGKKAGLLLAAPFMFAIAAYRAVQFGDFEDPASLIDFLNPLVCGLVILFFIHLYETMRAEAEDELVFHAETDALTGLPNRSRFQAIYDRTLDEARRSGVQFVLALMDIDHFKSINDSLGHDAGDIALKTLAGCLVQRLRSTDFVGRLGGEEFGLILRDTDRHSAQQLVDQLRQRIAAMPITYAGEKFHLTVTFGIASWPRDSATTTGLYQSADRRMYLGKHRGRNTVVSDDDAEADSQHECEPLRANNAD